MKRRIALLAACVSTVMMAACGTPSVPAQVEVEVPETTEQTLETVSDTAEEAVEEPAEEALEGIPSSELPDGWYYTNLQPEEDWLSCYTESAEFDGDILVFKASFKYADNLAIDPATEGSVYDFNTYLIQATTDTVTSGASGEQPVQDYEYEEFKTKMNEIYQHSGLGCYFHIESGVMTEIFVVS